MKFRIYPDGEIKSEEEFNEPSITPVSDDYEEVEVRDEIIEYIIEEYA